MPRLALTLRAWPVIAFATIGLCFFTGWVAGLFGITLDEQETVRQMRDMGAHAWRLYCRAGLPALFEDVASRRFLLNVAAVSVVAPVFEETLFRWLLARIPCGRTAFFSAPVGRRLVVCAAASSALFSLAHYLQTPKSNNAFLALFFFGLAQCWLYRKAERLWSPMLNHALFNLTNLVLLFAVPS